MFLVVSILLVSIILVCAWRLYVNRRSFDAELVEPAPPLTMTITRRGQVDQIDELAAQRGYILRILSEMGAAPRRTEHARFPTPLGDWRQLVVDEMGAGFYRIQLISPERLTIASTTIHVHVA